MYWIKYSAYALFLLILTGCGGKNTGNDEKNSPDAQGEEATSIQDYEWMLGTWFAHGLDFFEVWEKADDSTLVAKVYQELGDESTVSEEIQFRLRGGRFSYLPRVASQNKGLPVVFYAVNARKSMIQFENMAHDFPNRIVYFNTSDQQLDVKIEGVRNEEIFKSYDIVMSKMEE